MSLYRTLSEMFNKKSAPPKAPVDNTVDHYHGMKVNDPYRPLEDLNSARTKKFVEEHNKRFRDFIGKSRAQEDMEKHLHDVSSYETESLPVKYGNFYFTTYNDGLSAQPVYRVRTAPNGKPRVLIDPNIINLKGTTAISGTFPSPDGKLLAYLTSDDGSDDQTLRVMDVMTGKHKRDVIHGCRFTSIKWDMDGKGFTYNYPANDGLQRNVVKQHVLGRSAKHDPVIFESAGEAESFCSVGKILNEKGEETGLEYASVTIGTNAGNRLLLKTPAKGMFKRVFDDGESSLRPLAMIGGKLYATTNQGAPRGRLVAIDLKRPRPENWQTIIPEHKADLLQWAFIKNGSLMCSYSADTASRVAFYDFNGRHKHDMPLPPQSIIGFGSIGHKDKDIYVTLSGFTTSGAKYIYNFEKNSLTLWKPSASKMKMDDTVVERVFATSKDGTRVPMTIIRRKDVKLDGTAALKLYGYGGFNVPLGPGFSMGVYNWVKEGGIYVQANLRGGGEFGADWYNGGRLLNKQNVFDDFAACAEYLIDKKYTKAARLNINGGSNGGLLTLATMLQRPELFGAVTSHVPVTDMLRFHKFTYGAAWKSDYGDIERLKTHFNAAAAYSPLHNVKPRKQLPPTLVLTAAGDDRVVPSHSYKFIATMNARAPESLGLMRVTANAGHGAGMSKAQRISEMVEEHAFLVKALGPIDQNQYKAALKRHADIVRQPKNAGRK